MPKGKGARFGGRGGRGGIQHCLSDGCGEGMGGGGAGTHHCLLGERERQATTAYCGGKGETIWPTVG